MEFTLIAGAQFFPASMTNIYDLKHLGIQNMHRMQIFVLGTDPQLTEIAKRIYQLSLVTIKYHGHQDAGAFTKKYHFSFSGREVDLQKIRDALEIVGKDEDGEIEDPKEELALPVALFAGLSLGPKEKTL